ncbi:MAG: inositol monophosphatase family protein [Planctomycetota bacterium]|nr:inositol monophosphatase family protein [Planctomycetota bacterium]
MMQDTDSLANATQQRLDTALEFAHAAGELTLGFFGGSGFEVSTKHDGSPVTTADRGAETLLRERIEAAFPGDGILGEEFGEKASGNGWRWVLDPIDGTVSFVRGVPLYGTLVACEYEGQTQVGVIHMPALGETVHASAGQGAWHVAGPGAEPTRARVSGTVDIGKAMMCTTSFGYFQQAGTEASLGELYSRFGKTRGWSDCYAHVLCATGRIDAVVEPVLHPWDIAPMQVIYAEAGGRITDWRGRSGSQYPTGAATNGRFHDELVGLLAPYLTE